MGDSVKNKIISATLLRTPIAFVCNMALAYVAYWLCRLVFWAENYAAFPQFWSGNSLKDIFTGAWMFDTSAILYTNVLYAVVMLLPLHLKEHRWWQQVAKGLFVLVNSLAIIINLSDAVYFQYTGRRTTTTVFQEFSNEGNIGSIVGVELLRHWYLVVAGIALIVLLWKAYRLPSDIQSLHTEASRSSRRSSKDCATICYTSSCSWPTSR